MAHLLLKTLIRKSPKVVQMLSRTHLLTLKRLLEVAMIQKPLLMLKKRNRYRNLRLLLRILPSKMKIHKERIQKEFPQKTTEMARKRSHLMNQNRKIPYL